jgi:ribosomal protein S18 acetylase RimI-like enzyme
LLAGSRLLEEAHPQDEPHYYLPLIGTHPAHRGRRLGVQLLRSSLDTIDAQSMAAYLESTNPSNLGLYEHVGFTRIGCVDLPQGPTVHLMWRAKRGRVQA